MREVAGLRRNAMEGLVHGQSIGDDSTSSVEQQVAIPDQPVAGFALWCVFALGRRVGPAAPVGIDSTGSIVWQQWASVFCDPGRVGDLAGDAAVEAGEVGGEQVVAEELALVVPGHVPPRPPRHWLDMVLRGMRSDAAEGDLWWTKASRQRHEFATSSTTS
ncbi:hypothetical protein [Amycolatopsis sp. YIM 10]|uniref:hypothetical protein n=1 Tax=Amycolatopsis sp. YIM 10 TaxID=2653857 RepID=UPI00129078EA|nr:hypothetical protein [Amycolatopsis sp. YIM 10]